MNRTATQVIQDHLAKRLAGDVDGDIKENFSRDIVILSTFGVFKGHSGVKESADKLMGALGDAAFHYSHTLIEGSYAFLEWTGESDNRVVKDGADSFVVEDGKIVLQTIHYTALDK